MKRQTSGKGLVLYEQVLQKNFQIIETFLNKFPVIFKKQDNFQEALKKMTEKLFNLQQQTDKFRQEIHMTVSVLDKKISHLKENTSRNRSSVKFSQEVIPLQERKNSIFRISTSAKQQKQSGQLISKQKAQLLSEIDKKQQENIKKIQELQLTIEQMQQKIHFLSVMNGKNQQTADKLIQSKVDKSSFQNLSTYYDKKFQSTINEMAESKYEIGKKFIDQQFSFLESHFRSDIQIELTKVKSQLFSQLQKKAATKQFREQLKQIKNIIERMVDQSIQSFASKQQAKKGFMLFQKKITKLQLVIEQLLRKTLKQSSQEPSQGILFNLKKEKDGVMNGFGRKRKVNETG